MLEGLFILLFSLPCKEIRSPAVAGAFYPENPQGIRKAITAYIKDAPEAPQDVQGVIIPHAGWRYSGEVIGQTIGGFQGRKIKRIILMGTSHYGNFQGCSVGCFQAYQTPLGKYPVDQKAVKTLLKNPLFQFEKSAHQREHALEVEIPFLQVLFPEARIVPLLPGANKEEDYDAMARVLRPFINDETLVVCAVDFTHYGPNYRYIPFKDDIPSKLKKLDMGALHLLEKAHISDFFYYLQLTGATICGRFALPLMAALFPKASWEVVKYTTSGHLLNDWTNSVSYVGAWLHGKPEGKALTKHEAKLQRELTRKEQRVLLSLARSALKSLLFKTDDIAQSLLTLPHHPPYVDIAGVFVTIKKKGALRGCIGHIQGIKPLYQGVMENTLSASRYDYRFPPIQPEEYKDLSLEISVLSPLKKANSYRDIQLGTHGVVLRKANHQAVYLPQVAEETGWDLPTFLSHLSRKAGLPPSAWKEGAAFYLFTAQVFHE